MRGFSGTALFLAVALPFAGSYAASSFFAPQDPRASGRTASSGASFDASEAQGGGAPRGGRLVSAMDAAGLSALLRGLDVVALPLEENGGTGVRWEADGSWNYVYILEEGAVLRYDTAVSSSSATLAEVNAWNMNVRPSRSYIDEQGRPALALELSLAGGVTEARIMSFLLTCLQSRRTWMEVVGSLG
jgi:hypothetical protein